MTCKSIITIGRQYGSGGHEIGQKLAKELDIEEADTYTGADLKKLLVDKLGL